MPPGPSPSLGVPRRARAAHRSGFRDEIAWLQSQRIAFHLARGPSLGDFPAPPNHVVPNVLRCDRDWPGSCDGQRAASRSRQRRERGTRRSAARAALLQCAQRRARSRDVPRCRAGARIPRSGRRGAARWPRQGPGDAGCQAGAVRSLNPNVHRPSCARCRLVGGVVRTGSPVGSRLRRDGAGDERDATES